MELKYYHYLFVAAYLTGFATVAPFMAVGVPAAYLCEQFGLCKKENGAGASNSQSLQSSAQTIGPAASPSRPSDASISRANEPTARTARPA